MPSLSSQYLDSSEINILVDNQKNKLILPSLRNQEIWKNKIQEIQDYGICTITLFLRLNFHRELLKTTVINTGGGNLLN